MALFEDWERNGFVIMTRCFRQGKPVASEGKGWH